MVVWRILGPSVLRFNDNVVIRTCLLEWCADAKRDLVEQDTVHRLLGIGLRCVCERGCWNDHLPMCGPPNEPGSRSKHVQVGQSWLATYLVGTGALTDCRGVELGPREPRQEGHQSRHRFGRGLANHLLGKMGSA